MTVSPKRLQHSLLAGAAGFGASAFYVAAGSCAADLRSAVGIESLTALPALFALLLGGALAGSLLAYVVRVRIGTAVAAAVATVSVCLGALVYSAFALTVIELVMLCIAFPLGAMQGYFSSLASELLFNYSRVRDAYSTGNKIGSIVLTLIYMLLMLYVRGFSVADPFRQAEQRDNVNVFGLRCAILAHVFICSCASIASIVTFYRLTKIYAVRAIPSLDSQRELDGADVSLESVCPLEPSSGLGEQPRVGGFFCPNHCHLKKNERSEVYRSLASAGDTVVCKYHCGLCHEELVDASSYYESVQTEIKHMAVDYQMLVHHVRKQFRVYMVFFFAFSLLPNAFPIALRGVNSFLTCLSCLAVPCAGFAHRYVRGLLAKRKVFLLFKRPVLAASLVSAALLVPVMLPPRLQPYFVSMPMSFLVPFAAWFCYNVCVDSVFSDTAGLSQFDRKQRMFENRVTHIVALLAAVFGSTVFCAAFYPVVEGFKKLFYGPAA